MDILLITVVFILILIIMLLRFGKFPLASGTSELGEYSLQTLIEKNQINKYELAAVMVEPRVKNLVQTIQTFLGFLPPSTHFVIYHGLDNQKILQDHFQTQINENKIQLHNLNVHNLTIQSYNYLLTSPVFYESIPSENILIFQTDTTLCSNSPFKISDFTQFDYIGAPMHNLINNLIHFQFLAKGEFNGFRNHMNGGLSFRKKSKMIEVLTKNPWDHHIPEDVWICSQLYKEGGNLPTREQARNFSFETENLIQTPLGLHKPRKNLEELQIICPEVNQIETIPSHTDYRSLFLL
jgi:hypothetical protein